MADYQAVPRSGDMQFGDPLDFSGLDPSVLTMMAVSKVNADQQALRLQAIRQAGQTAGLAATTDDIQARQAPADMLRSNPGSINSIHPDVFDALIQAEKSGGALGKSWGQEVSGLIFGQPGDSLNSEAWKP